MLCICLSIYSTLFVFFVILMLFLFVISVTSQFLLCINHKISCLYFFFVFIIAVVVVAVIIMQFVYFLSRYKLIISHQYLSDKTNFVIADLFNVSLYFNHCYVLS